MQIEKIFGEIPIFHDIKIDKILFESSYPILFTCIENRNIFFDTLNIILLIIAVLNCFDDIFWHIVDSKYHQICTTILLIYLFGVMIYRKFRKN